MNNEEKILEMLEKLNGKADGLTGTVEKHSEMFQQIFSRMDQMQEDQKQIRADMSQIQTTLTRVAVTQENVVIPQIKLLAEGHELLLQKLARKERVEALEDDVALLKTVVKTMSERITELEKAQ